MAPRCQQAEGPGAGCGTVGSVGKEGVTTAFSWSVEEGLTVPNRGARGTGVAVRVGSSLTGAEGEDVSSAAVGDGRRVVLTLAGDPGAPEGGLCPGEKAGRPASGRSSSVLGGCCRGCRMADGASTAFGKAETEAQGSLEGGGRGRTRDWRPELSTVATAAERLWASFFINIMDLIPPVVPLNYWGCEDDHTRRLMGKYQISRLGHKLGGWPLTPMHAWLPWEGVLRCSENSLRTRESAFGVDTTLYVFTGRLVQHDRTT